MEAIWLSPSPILALCTFAMVQAQETYVSDGTYLGIIPPDIPETAVTITLENNELKTIGQNAFSKFTGLQTLNLNSNDISFIDSTAFEGTQVVILRISGNSFSNAPDLSAIGSTLKELWINVNHLATLKENSFTGLSNLQRIYLPYNGMHSINKDSFNPFRETIQVISLSYNNLFYVHPGTFRGMSSLAQLYIGGNKFSQLPDLSELYGSKSSLFYLALFENQMQKAEADDVYELIENLPALTILALNEAGLKTFPDIRPLKHFFQHLLFLSPDTMQCTCDLQWLKDEQFISTYFEHLYVNSTTPLCTFAGEEAPRALKDIDDFCVTLTTTLPISSSSSSSLATPPSNSGSTRGGDPLDTVSSMRWIIVGATCAGVLLILTAIVVVGVCLYKQRASPPTTAQNRVGQDNPSFDAEKVQMRPRISLPENLAPEPPPSYTQSPNVPSRHYESLRITYLVPK